jgi:hypothetical protein
LPTLGGDWRYIKHKSVVGVLFPVARYSEVDAYLRLAFGPPANSIGWTVRDIGVYIHILRTDTDTEVDIISPNGDR